MLAEKTSTQARFRTAEPGSVLLAITISLLLLVDTRQLSAQTAREFEVGVSREQFQSDFDKKKQQGLRLIDLTTTIANKQTSTAWVWETRPGVEWKGSAGLTHEEMQKEVTAADTSGFRLTHLTAYVDGSTPRYSALWDKSEGPALSIKYGVPHDKMMDVNRELATDGFRPVRMAAVTAGREVLMTGLWEKTTDPLRELQVGLSDVRVKREIRTRQRQGFRAIQICNYPVGGQVKFSCIWEKSVEVDQHIDVNVTKAAVERLQRLREKQGFHVAQIGSCTLRSRVLYAVIWEKPREGQ